MKETRAEIVFQGNGVSPGIALGTALKMDSHNRVILKTRLDAGAVEEEIRRLQEAVQASREQLEVLKLRLEEKVGKEHAFILDAHILMLEDRSLMDEIFGVIRDERVNAAWAVRHVTDRIRNAYQSLEDEYFRERAHDIEDVVERILLNLSGDKPAVWKTLPQDLILVAHDFNPSAFAAVDLQKVRALVLESGGRTSHTAIIARSLRIPVVMEIKGFLSEVSTGDQLLVNGDDGFLVLNPSVERVSRLRSKMEHEPVDATDFSTAQGGAALTEDGSRILLQANTELPLEVLAAKKYGAEGIGLFRSEFLFFAHPQGIPTMSGQLQTYRMLAEEMSPYVVAIRTLDAGGDKTWPGMEGSTEPNPSMGLRGIRLSLRLRDQFMDQVEAIFRAGVYGKLEIVLPMISTVEELWEARRIIEEVRNRIRLPSGAAPEPIPVGAMIEVPAAVLTIDRLGPEVDFLCVGTNDLIQYLLAVDRDNPHVAHLFQPLHPSILHCLSRIAAAGEKLGKPVRICGEMSSNPLVAVLLLGLGYRQLSMNPRFIPEIRSLVRSVTIRDCRQIADKCMALHTAGEIAQYLVHEVSRLSGTDASHFLKELGADETGRDDEK